MQSFRKRKHPCDAREVQSVGMQADNVRHLVVTVAGAVWWWCWVVAYGGVTLTDPNLSARVSGSLRCADMAPVLFGKKYTCYVRR